MRLWLVALLALLLMAAPAHAGGTLIADEGAALGGGPVFAGDRVVWASRSLAPDGYAVHVAAPDGAGREVRHVEAPLVHASFATFAFDASERRSALSLQVNRYPCGKGCNAEIVYSRISSGPLGAAHEPLAVPCFRDYPGDASVSVDGNVVAALVDCGLKTVVRDFDAGDGQPRDFELPGAFRIRLAGPYVARYEERQLVVNEWRTGAERLRVAGSSAFDLRSDGTVAYVVSEGGRHQLMVASPEQPVPRLVAEDGGGLVVRIAGDRVAVDRPGGGVGVRRLDGSLVAESATAGLTDFDGGRVAWADRSCARAAIATWDLQGPAPGLPRANPCPIATLRSTTLRATSGSFGPGSVRVKLTCAPEPAVGCVGGVELFAKDARRKYDGRLVDMARGSYRLLPGQSQTLELGYLKRRVCIAGENGLRPMVELTGPAPLGSTTARAKRRRVRVVGLEKAIAACRA